MKQYLINEQEVNYLIQSLGEVPAKISYKPINLLQKLPIYVENKVVTTENSETKEDKESEKGK
jgi:hypothetical protein